MRPRPEELLARPRFEALRLERPVQQIGDGVHETNPQGLAASRVPSQQGHHCVRPHHAVRTAGVVSLFEESELCEEDEHPHPLPGRIRLLGSGPLADRLACSLAQRARVESQLRELQSVRPP